MTGLFSHKAVQKGMLASCVGANGQPASASEAHLLRAPREGVHLWMLPLPQSEPQPTEAHSGEVAELKFFFKWS